MYGPLENDRWSVVGLNMFGGLDVCVEGYETHLLLLLY